MKLRKWILILSFFLTFLSSTGIASANDCVIREWGLAKDVSNMKPVGLAQKFSSKEVSQVFVFASLNCLVVPDAVIVKFDRTGKTVPEKKS